MKIIINPQSIDDGGNYHELVAKLESNSANIRQWFIDGYLRWVGKLEENTPGANVDAQQFSVIGD